MYSRFGLGLGLGLGSATANASIILAENANGCDEAVNVNDRSGGRSVGGGSDGVEGDDGGSAAIKFIGF